MYTIDELLELHGLFHTRLDEYEEVPDGDRCVTASLLTLARVLSDGTEGLAEELSSFRGR
jgi:hypothetical protein